MLSDLHDSVEAMLRSALSPGDDLTVLFGSPALVTDSVARPAVNLFLNDVREDRRHRASDWSPTRDDNGLVAGWQPPFRHYCLTYLATVWAAAEAEEANLIGEMLLTLGGYLVLPEPCHRGWLQEERLPVLLEVANPPYSISEIWAVWAAVGMPARPSVHLALTIPLRSRDITPAAPAVAGRRLSLTSRGGEQHPVIEERIDPGRRDQEVRNRRYGVIAREGRGSDLS
jgi:hypothetical protein